MAAEPFPFPKTPPEPKSRAGLFRHPPPKSEPSPELAAEVNNLARRLKMVEERYTSLRKKSQVSDQNMLQVHKEFKATIKAVNEDLLDLKRELHDLREKMKLMVRELKEGAKREEVLLLKKYVDLWEPLKFATVRDVERMIEDKLYEQQHHTL